MLNEQFPPTAEEVRAIATSAEYPDLVTQLIADKLTQLQDTGFHDILRSEPDVVVPEIYFDLADQIENLQPTLTARSLVRIWREIVKIGGVNHTFGTILAFTHTATGDPQNLTGLTRFWLDNHQLPERVTSQSGLSQLIRERLTGLRAQQQLLKLNLTPTFSSSFADINKLVAAIADANGNGQKQLDYITSMRTSDQAAQASAVMVALHDGMGAGIGPLANLVRTP